MTTLMAPFSFEKPTQLNELFALIKQLQQQDQRYSFAGGGTDLLPMFKTGLNVPDCVISLTALKELSGISVFYDESNQQQMLRIGATTRLSTIVTNDEIKTHFPELSRVAGLVASPQIRNQATLGGNLMVDNRCLYINQSAINRTCHRPCFKANGDVCHLVKSAKRGDETLCQARFVSDTVPILLLLNATLVLQNATGIRKVPLSSFYKKDGIERHQLQTGELLVAIELATKQHKQLHYEKLAIRKTLDFPSVGIAVALSTDHSAEQDKPQVKLEVACTGIQTLPGYFAFTATDAQSSSDLLVQACTQVEQFSLIYQQDFFPRAYRKKMISVLIHRCFNLITETK